KTGRLGERQPEEIVAAGRCLDPEKDERLLGQLMMHVSDLAIRFLAGRIDKNLPNGGKDTLDNVRDRMLTAILDPKAKDGPGYETAFYPKLSQRLIDEIRRNTKQRERYKPFAEDEDGETIEPTDTRTLSPEEVAIMQNAIQQLPDNLRKAFVLRRAG